MLPTSITGLASTGLIAFAAIAVVVLFFVLLNRPDWGLFLLVAATPFEQLLNISFTLTKAAKLTLTALVMAVYFLTYGGVRNRLSRYPYSLAHSLLIVSGIIATLASTIPTDSAIGVMQLVVVFLLCYLVYCEGFDEERAVGLLRLCIWLGIALAPMALAQTLFGYRGVLGSFEQQADAAEGLFDMVGGLYRSSATFGSANTGGAFFYTAAAMAALHAGVFRATRTLYGVGAVLCLAAALSTSSRGAAMGAVLALSLLVPTRRIFLKAFAVVATLVAVGVILFYFSPESIVYLVRPGQGTESRLNAWRWALEIFREHWWTGIGIYGFKPYIEANFPHLDIPRQPHNGLLKAVVEQGLLGGLGYILFVIAFGWNSLRILRAEVAGSSRWFVASGVAAMGICIFTQELFDAGFTVGGSSTAVLFAVLLGTQAAMRSPLAVTAPGKAPARRRVPLVARVSRS
jgi:O-antigen ligase